MTNATMKRIRFFLALIFIPHLFTPACLGQMTNILPNGDKYVGEWKDDQFAGPVK